MKRGRNDGSGINGSTVTVVGEYVHNEVALKASYKVVEAVASAGIEASDSAGIEYSTVLDDLLSANREEELKIGPGVELYLYQRAFQGPGMSCALKETFQCADPNLADKWKDVKIVVTTRPQRFIKYMRVAYGDGEAQAPEDHVREIDGKSADINNGQGGKYVWMKKPQEGLQDLAAGAGGDFRYVYSNHNEHADIIHRLERYI
ncbi:hypothetical protein GGX14DRAFT_567869 [Mycena pura]|uniref:Uncharacterized protein n=1 Tax=Mycena pura TaxID=153505 RepID=A0AAD6Y9D0_9AGAR|nr:hypothetical protein GGX14DRAFT_567869 [Mycena pura]